MEIFIVEYISLLIRQFTIVATEEWEPGQTSYFSCNLVHELAFRYRLTNEEAEMAIYDTVKKIVRHIYLFWRKSYETRRDDRSPEFYQQMGNELVQLMELVVGVKIEPELYMALFYFEIAQDGEVLPNPRMSAVELKMEEECIMKGIQERLQIMADWGSNDLESRLLDNYRTITGKEPMLKTYNSDFISTRFERLLRRQKYEEAFAYIEDVKRDPRFVDLSINLVTFSVSSAFTFFTEKEWDRFLNLVPDSNLDWLMSVVPMTMGFVQGLIRKYSHEILNRWFKVHHDDNIRERQVKLLWYPLWNLDLMLIQQLLGMGADPEEVERVVKRSGTEKIKGLLDFRTKEWRDDYKYHPEYGFNAIRSTATKTLHLIYFFNNLPNIIANSHRLMMIEHRKKETRRRGGVSLFEEDGQTEQMMVFEPFRNPKLDFDNPSLNFEDRETHIDRTHLDRTDH
jgi:hypothetical protein